MRPLTSVAQQTDDEVGFSSSGKTPKKNTSEKGEVPKRGTKRKHGDITDVSQSEDSGKESGNQGVTSSDAEKQKTSQSKTPEAELIEVEQSGKDSSSDSPAVSQIKDSEKENGTKQVEQPDVGKEDTNRPSQTEQRLFTIQVTKVGISFSFFIITCRLASSLE